MAKPKKKQKRKQKKKPAPRKRIARRVSAKPRQEPQDNFAFPASPQSNLNQIAPKLTYKIAGTPILPPGPKS